MTEERRVETWPKIARLAGMSLRTIYRFRKELVSSGTVFFVFLQVPTKDGRQKRYPQKVACTFPGSVRKWLAIRTGEKGEIITPKSRPIKQEKKFKKDEIGIF